MACLRSLLVSCLMVAAVGRESSSLERALEKTSLHEGLNTMVLRAREWLRTHQDPDQAGMDELKTTNPDAFAIVQALLTKKSLGLLNAKHPDAFGGFDGTPSAATPDAPSAEASAAPEAPAVPLAAIGMDPPQSHKNFFNWKPNTDDDSMVSNVLGEVAQLKNGGASSPVEVAQPLSEPEKHTAGMVSLKVVAPVEHAQESQDKNPYFKSVAPVAKSDVVATPVASMSQANSYLNAVNLGPKHVGGVDSPNALSGFSWNDDNAADTTSSQQVQSAQPTKEHALTSWLR